jgi:hypothetical protein
MVLLPLLVFYVLSVYFEEVSRNDWAGVHSIARRGSRLNLCTGASRPRLQRAGKQSVEGWQRSDPDFHTYFVGIYKLKNYFVF